MKLIEDLGTRTVGNKGRKKRYGVYECPICFKHFEVVTESVKSGASTKCRDCYVKSKVIPKSAEEKSLISVFKGMKYRCYNKKGNAYKDYGGRGIEVDSVWKDSRDTFIGWALSNGYKIGLCIDRIDNDGNYSPANCRFITAAENNTNKRLYAQNNTGERYIRQRKSGSYRVKIYRNKKVELDKSFKTLEGAINERDRFTNETK